MVQTGVLGQIVTGAQLLLQKGAGGGHLHHRHRRPGLSGDGMEVITKRDLREQGKFPSAHREPISVGACSVG